MKKTILISFAAVSLFLNSSCKKVLNTTPVDFITPENYFKTEADATKALNSAIDIMTRQYFYAGYYQARMMASDDIFCPFSGSFPANLNFNATEPSHIPSRWNNLYSMIEQLNILLNNMGTVEGDAANIAAIKGEALFMRAYAYFVLVDEWGAVPLKLKPTAGPNDISIARTSVAEVYAQIVKDMTEAEVLVPTTASALYGGAGYPAKTTIQGILARVCLTMAGEPLKDISKYEDAKNWAQKVIDSREHSLNPDYSKIFINLAANQFDKKEVLWEVDFNDVQGTTEHGYLGYLDGIQGAAASFGNSVGQVNITRKLYRLYDATGKDLRRDWNISPFFYKNSTTTGAPSDRTYYTSSQIYDRRLSSNRQEYSPGSKVVNRSCVNFPLLRYSDVLLMRAEAENYLSGPTDLAYSLVNQVRARAYGKLLPGSTDLNEADLPRTHNKDSFLQEIQNERCRELPGDYLRKHDLIRWGIFVSSLKEMGVDVNDSAQPAVAAGWRTPVSNIANRVSERDLLWPIPPSEMTYNKLMTQNPGW